LGRCGVFAKRLPRRGGSGRHDKVEQMTEVAVSKKCILVVAQTLKLVQGDGVCFEILPLTAFAERLVAGARGRLPPLFL